MVLQLQASKNTKSVQHAFAAVPRCAVTSPPVDQLCPFPSRHKHTHHTVSLPLVRHMSQEEAPLVRHLGGAGSQSLQGMGGMGPETQQLHDMLAPPPFPFPPSQNNSQETAAAAGTLGSSQPELPETQHGAPTHSQQQHLNTILDLHHSSQPGMPSPALMLASRAAAPIPCFPQHEWST